MQFIKIPGLLSLLLILSFSCKDKKEEEQELNFEKKEIMVQLADQLIQPAYEDFQSKMDALSASWSVFKNNPGQTAFNDVQSKWVSAYTAFQYVKIFDFGPALDQGFVAALGTFPSDTAKIEANISSGSYTLTALDNFAAIGFPSMDYLFFESNALSQLSVSGNRQQYVTDVLAKMKNETDAVLNAWPGYRSSFIESTGTSSTSAFSQLVNAFSKDYELAKNAKIGIPLGKQSLDIQRPEYLEARKSGIGKELLVENLKALRLVFLGNSLSGASGKGFDDYLIALEKQSLATNIETRFDALIADPASWNGSIENMMQAENQTLQDYYNYMQQTVVYIKTDMTSAFGILITYQDNDGD